MFYNTNMNKDVRVLSDFISNEKCPIAFRLIGNCNTLFHTHDYVEIFYMISGNTSHRYENEPTTTLGVGDAYIILPTKSHIFGLGNPSASHRDVFIKDSFFKEVCDFISPTLYEELFNGDLPCHIKLNQSELHYFENRIDSINQILLDTLFQETVESFAKCLVSTLVSSVLCKPIENHSQNFPVWFKNLLERFNDVKLVSEGLDAIISDTNYDRKYLCRVFKKNTGLTMTEYLNKVRLDFALSTIQNTDKNILTVAQDLGFSSISYFNVSFKKRYGITPSQAKKYK